MDKNCKKSAFQIQKWLTQSHSLLSEKLERSKKEQKSKKDSCPLCQEEKKRPLNAYLRKRSQDKSDKCGKICEEDEEEQQKHCHSSHHDQQNKQGKK